ncbi:hypothetical protein F4780DRAFT_776806 [Xylariomycetidae sp. FL0641]|nr:hypothetical protein F4780DRAFT_776806 [Xylariomycetidae sp. FL0641]
MIELGSRSLLAAAGLGLLLTGTAAAAAAARACGPAGGPAASYAWQILDARFDDGGDDGAAVVGVSLVPDGTSTFFECVAAWPEAWAGRYPDPDDNENENLPVWSDCIWTGAGPTYDTAVGFALDWAAPRTLYLTHTFACADREGVTAMATGQVELDMNCTASTPSTCVLANGGSASTLRLSTTSHALPSAAASNTTTTAATTPCTNATTSPPYQSWQLDGWTRSYAVAPATVPPAADSGPAFRLRNLATGGAGVRCSVDNATASTNNSMTKGGAAGGRKRADDDDNDAGLFAGTCEPIEPEPRGRRRAPGKKKSRRDDDGEAATRTSFTFDPVLDLLVVTQRWACGGGGEGGGTPVEATGVAFVQAGCSRDGDMFRCSSGPLWIGTETP